MDQAHVTDLDRQGLRDPQPRVLDQAEEEVVAPAHLEEVLASAAEDVLG